MKTKEQELKEELNRIKGLVQNLEGKIEALELEKEDKFAELKEAYKNGRDIQLLIGSCWHDVWFPKWNEDFEYRIKPEEEPNVGDIVKVWDAKEGKFFIGTLYKKGIYDVPYPFMVKLYNSRDDYNFYGNAEKITKQEAIDLLFGSED